MNSIISSPSRKDEDIDVSSIHISMAKAFHKNAFCSSISLILLQQSSSAGMDSLPLNVC